MRHRPRMLEVLRRAESGPMIDEKAFERELVAPTVRRLVEKYAIDFDGSRVVSNDAELADRVFAAGLELATEVGLFCQDTSRRITWSREELEDGLRHCPQEATMGAGSDQVTVRARVPGDNTVPIISGGPYGVSIPEELFVPLMLSYARESAIDMIDNATLDTAYGMGIKARSPLEPLGAWREAELSMEVVKRAGRQGICIGCVEQSATALGEISATSYGGFRLTDQHKVATLSEFKTNYDMLTKVVHLTRVGALMSAYYNPIYGGFVGGAEGVALALTAGPILLNQSYMGTTYGGRPNHPFLGCDTTPELLWAMSVAFQAISRNTNLLIHALAGPAGGPGTKTMLYENAAFTLTTAASGISMIACSMSAAGTHARHATGLDAKICAEVARAARGLSLDEANEFVRALLEKYEEDLSPAPVGQPFEELYDVETVTPTSEWQATYDEVCQELTGLGLPMDRLR